MSDLRPTDDVHPAVNRQETCSLVTVRRVAAMLDQDPDRWSDGDVLPCGWQFILLGADTRRSALRQDGFPGLGMPLPDLGLPLLLLGGRTVRYDGDIQVGASLCRESRVQKLSCKETANGPMAIVTVSHALCPAETPHPVLIETQTYILLSAQSASRKAMAPAEVIPPATTKHVVPDDTLLFQYSALGFNSHRIHLGRCFARETEGFPDLVVNGGLATLLLTEFLRTELGGTLTALTARHVAPLFCGRPILLGAERRGDKWLLRAFDDTGRLAVDIEAEA
jgi:3-methylfumaryl-CoA hydratase